MGGLPALGQPEERRLRNRALARWLLSAGPDTPAHQRLMLTSEVMEQDGLACAQVIAADGAILASYPICSRTGRLDLLHSLPGTIAPPPPPARAAALRKSSAGLLSRSRELRHQCMRLRTRSLTALRRSVVLLENAAGLRDGSCGTAARARLLRARSAALRAQARAACRDALALSSPQPRPQNRPPLAGSSRDGT